MPSGDRKRVIKISSWESSEVRGTCINASTQLARSPGATPLTTHKAMVLADFLIATATVLGFISLFKNLIAFAWWLHAAFLRRPKDLHHYGSWAVVTGATDGIGKALVFKLASKGLNLVLVGRNPSKLEATARELRERYGTTIEVHPIGSISRFSRISDGKYTLQNDIYFVQVKTVIADFAKLSGEEIAAAIARETEGIDVGLIVNNAGVAYPYPKYFHEVDRELMESVLRVNMNAAVWVTKGGIDGMLKKKRGAIVNMGSGSTVCISSYPLLTLYASTKAFLATFSRSISLEYEEQGIDIQCQTPLFVSTNMTKMKRRYFFIPSAEMFSRASVRWIGHDRECNPYWSHSVQAFVAHTLDAITVWGLECYMKWCRGARERSHH